MITQDNINFLFGAFGSGAAKAASTVSEKYKVPTIAAAASSSQVYDQGYKYLFGTFTPKRHPYHAVDPDHQVSGP